jgi:hypothetical protein
MFAQCQKYILALFPKEYHAYLQDLTSPLPVGETHANLQIRKNLQQELSAEITDLSQQFRSMQRQYMQSFARSFYFFDIFYDSLPVELQGKEASSSSSSATSSDFDEPEVYTRVWLFTTSLFLLLPSTPFQGFTPEQEEAVAYNRENVQERLNEIKQIARSMNQLASMFQEIHMMVVEQGTLLDRVDQNLVSARQQTEEAVKELTKVYSFLSPLSPSLSSPHSHLHRRMSTTAPPR